MAATLKLSVKTKHLSHQDQLNHSINQHKPDGLANTIKITSKSLKSLKSQQKPMYKLSSLAMYAYHPCVSDNISLNQARLLRLL